jgi:hypothetical protein
MAFLYIKANVHNFKCPADQWIDMSSSTTQTGGNQIKRIPVKELTWVSLYDLKEAGQSYDELLAGMIQRERDYRDWKMITEIEKTGEFVAFDEKEIMKGD